MKTKEILLTLINDLEEFEGIDTACSFDDFLFYLNQKYPKNTSDFKRYSDVVVDEIEVYRKDNQKINVSILFTLMSKYSKGYIKKVLEQSLIKTSDEFIFLITMLTVDSISKTGLINKLVTEKTSGIETIKRLVKKGFLSEFKSDEDKKSVFVKITDNGRKEIFSILPEMNKVASIITGNLTSVEIQSLTQILIKLDEFHNDIYFDSNMKDIETIYEEKVANGT